MKILVLGAGAIGGYFGGRLAESGADVTFLVRPARRESLERDGLHISSPLGDLRLPVRSVGAENLPPRYDIVLLTCKAYDLDSAMDAIAPVMTGECAILPLLNGMAHLERLDARFGAAHVLGGTCMIDAELLPDGTIRHGGTLQRLVFGERSREHTPRSAALAELFAATTFEAELADDIVQRLWDKLVFLAALAATTSLFRANVAEIVGAPGGREVMERALAANLAIAEHEGHPLGPDAAAFAHGRLTDPRGSWSASLRRDLEAGHRVEADQIVGWMLDRARLHAVDDTVLALSYTGLKAYEARLAVARAG